MQDSPEVGKSGRRGLVSRVRRVGNKSGSREDRKSGRKCFIISSFLYHLFVCSYLARGKWRVASGDWGIEMLVIRNYFARRSLSEGGDIGFPIIGYSLLTHDYRLKTNDFSSNFSPPL